MPADVLGLFLTTALLLALTPGPDNLFVLSQSMVFGSRAGWLVVLGLCSGLLVHTTLVALGLAALLAASDKALLLVKIVGATYLIYLAWRNWRDSSRPVASSSALSLGALQLYRRGIFMNITNPKVTLFFLALLPQFVDSAYGNVSLQFFLLGGLFIASTLLVFGAIASLAGRFSAAVNPASTTALVLKRLLSLLFVLLALNLFVDYF